MALVSVVLKDRMLLACAHEGTAARSQKFKAFEGLAERLPGGSRLYVSRLERALENPTVGVLERFSQALDHDLREFFDPSAAGKAVEPLQKGRKRRALAKR